MIACSSAAVAAVGQVHIVLAPGLVADWEVGVDNLVATDCTDQKVEVDQVGVVGSSAGLALVGHSLAVNLGDTHLSCSVQRHHLPSLLSDLNLAMRVEHSLRLAVVGRRIDLVAEWW